MVFSSRRLFLRIWFGFMVLCLSGWSGLLVAQTPEDAAEQAQVVASPGPVVVAPVGANLPNHTAYIGQVILGLLLVLAMIFAIAWLLRRFGQGTLVGSQQMKIVSSLPLGPRERLIIVDVNGEQLLIGVAPGRISQLHHFSEPVIPAKTKDDGDFGHKLKEILSRSTLK
jgi:flagellar protein FliO/FliZ